MAKCTSWDAGNGRWRCNRKVTVKQPLFISKSREVALANRQDDLRRFRNDERLASCETYFESEYPRGGDWSSPMIRTVRTRAPWWCGKEYEETGILTRFRRLLSRFKSISRLVSLAGYFEYFALMATIQNVTSPSQIL